jgi:hypothetical protein
MNALSCALASLILLDGIVAQLPLDPASTSLLAELRECILSVLSLWILRGRLSGG